MNDLLVIDKDRFISIDDFVLKRAKEADSYYELDINPSNITVKITSGKLLITDPNYLADIFNSDGIKEKYLKKYGVLLMDFGGDVSGPVFRTKCGGLKIVLTFDRTDDNGKPIFRKEAEQEFKQYEVDSSNLGCDSGSYIFLDYNLFLRTLFAKELAFNKKIMNDLFIIDMKNGTYNVGYEQWDTDEKNPYDYLRRNLVVWPVE